jgi:hypothetical protein
LIQKDIPEKWEKVIQKQGSFAALFCNSWGVPPLWKSRAIELNGHDIQLGYGDRSMVQDELL